MIDFGDRGKRPWPAAALRFALLLALWIVLTLGDPADLPAGIATAIAATWTSLLLYPPDRLRRSLPGLATFALRFLNQSVVAGIDVAWRALAPRLPLKTGFLIYRCRLPEGRAQSAFCTLASLLPGTLPTESEQGGGLLIHCLDTEQPVAAQLSADEAHFTRAWGVRRDG